MHKNKDKGELSFAEEEAARGDSANRFLDECLIPAYNVFEEKHIPNLTFTDVIDPLLNDFLETNPGAYPIELADVSISVLKRERGSSINYESIERALDELRDEHARAEHGVTFRYSSSDKAEASNLRSKLKAINKKVKDYKSMGRGELLKRQERRSKATLPNSNILDFLTDKK